MSASDADGAHVLVFAPIGRDAAATADLLRRTRIRATICSDLDALVAGLDDDVGAVFIAEEGLFGKDLTPLAKKVLNQPAWSDLPFIMLTSHQEQPAVVAWRRNVASVLRNVFLLDRPLQPITLTSALRAALRARLHQVEVRDLLDIRERTAQDLHESEARFRAAVQAVSGIMWTNNARGEMEGEQPAWAALTGQCFDEYQGYGWVRAIHPDDAQPTIDAWNATVVTRRTFVFEHRVRRHDGVWRPFAIRAIPVLREDGVVQKWVGVHTDVTEQREAEAVLSRDKVQLEQLVAERTRELETAQARLAHVQRMEALGQLAGGIAHDFNNVLQAVQGGAGLIGRRATDPEGVRHLASMVFDAANRGSAITRRLLAFSRQGDLRTEAVDPTSLLTGLREILTHTLGAGIGVRVDAPAGLPSLQADKGQLETVLINMATNARDAMDGQGLLTLAAATEAQPHADGLCPAVDLKAGSYIRLQVSDTGTGMTPEVLARVTEPFFTTKPQGQGTGLGLAMARGFIEQSGGGMLITSQPGQGTTVTIWMPLADVANTLTKPDGEARNGGQSRAARLLVVDDEPLVREIITQQLRSAGHAVVSVGSPQAALAVLDSDEPIDLIVSDLSMPGMDGVALVREANRRRPKVPAILLTGFATNAAEIALSGAVSGMFSLLRKPVTEQELAERVAKLLEGPAEIAVQ